MGVKCIRGEKNCCVAGDTRIWTPQGYREISWLHDEFEMGHALSVNTMRAGRVESAKVVRVWTDPHPKQIIRFDMDIGGLICTPYHLVRVLRDGRETWERADAITKGTRLSCPPITDECTVFSVTKERGEALVYDIELEGDNYIANGVIVGAYAKVVA